MRSHPVFPALCTFQWIVWNSFLRIFFPFCENLVVNWVIVFLFHDIWWDWQHLLVDISKWTAFLGCVCRRLHIDSNFIFGNTIGIIGWSTFYPVLCPKILLHHHQCHRQPPHLFCLQYLWNLKVPPEQELESEGKGSMQINATWLGFFTLQRYHHQAPEMGFKERSSSMPSRMPVPFCFCKPNERGESENLGITFCLSSWSKLTMHCMFFDTVAFVYIKFI